MQSSEETQNYTSQTTGKPDGSKTPEWFSRLTYDAKRYLGEQAKATWEVDGQTRMVEVFIKFGSTGPDAEAAAAHALLARRNRHTKALTGSFPSGMRENLKGLSERLPEPMASKLGDLKTLSAVLMGPTGCGKTTAAAVLVLRCAPPSLHWCYATDLAMADRYHKLGDGEPPAIMRARSAPALVLDDIGAEPSPALWTILNHRYHEGLPTIATTGLTRDELTAAIGAAAVRRLRDQHAGHDVLVVDCHGS